MESVNTSVERHYGHEGIYDAIVSALKEQGVDIRRVQSDDLAMIDEFHVRAREGTVELAGRHSFKPGSRVLDVGCGIGGSSRFLATKLGCNVTGIDLTHEFVATAIRLSELVGLDGSIKFQQASALELPFADNSFDVVWTQHVQMNIKDKQRFYAEMARVLVPGGHMVFHDIFQNEDHQPYFPVPWAADPSISFLTTPEKARSIIESLGLRIVDWEETTAKSLEWMLVMAERAKAAPKPMPGLQIVMGNQTNVRLENAMRSLADDRIKVIQAVAEK
ncbi:SAM-dependent methyltransferase [candidate division GN15 bacterium]|uniref:SAM-dependent methyltransferase n=1 Tax=candidate division GN15 bacterium TaxID=2072418 RepID=A0A855X3C6_9BACT|nr:MAG: SAM-dependent methyltransferase [candidate division GN15 bacterium]